MKGQYTCSVLRCVCGLVLLFALWNGSTNEFSMAYAADSSVLMGTVSDVEGRAVEGAMVFVYDNSDVRRSADFISAPTNSEGRFRMVVPEGRYWGIARIKTGEDFGPLMPGDRHSGDPVEIEVAPDSKVIEDFIVADLKEAIRMKREEMDRPVKLSGRIISEDGTPVIKAYAFAHKSELIPGIPDFVSAWVDSEGRYEMYLPRGRYYVGGAVTFPVGKDYFLERELTVEADNSGFDIKKTSRNNSLVHEMKDIVQ